MSEKNNINTDKLLEVHDRLHKTAMRFITTEDISYISELSKDYVNEQIEKSIEVLKNGGNNCAKYIIIFNNKYSLLPTGSFMIYLAATQMDDGTEEFKTFVNALLLLIQIQISVDEFVISMFYKEDIYNFAN